MTIGRTPFIRLISPLRDISPMKAQPSSPSPIILIPRRIAMNIAISCTEPLFFVSAGARFIITEATGKLILHERSAALIRSRLSFTTVSGSPTTSNCGFPRLMSISTSTGNAFSPKSPRLDTFANIVYPPYLNLRPLSEIRPAFPVFGLNLSGSAAALTFLFITISGIFPISADTSFFTAG